jgi:hypothetical protein
VKLPSPQIVARELDEPVPHVKDAKALASDAVKARRAICAQAVETIMTTSAEGLLAIVLTGSLARDEGTFVVRSDFLELLGDADFLLVYGHGTRRSNSGTDSSLNRKIEVNLLNRGIRCRVHANAVSQRYFRRLPRAIFTYELKKCGRLVAGDSKVLESIPDFTGAEISRDDAWRMLCNRIIEHLAFVGDLSNTGSQLSPELHYATVKLFLDMATSYLVFAGEYAPTYRERADRLMALARQSNHQSPFPLTKFASRVAECTSWKISGDEEGCDRRVELWHDAISYMRRLWRWEMIELTHARNDLTIAGLSNQLARQQTVSQRVRGWASVVKRSGWLKSASQWPRWMRLATRSTPRYLVYQAAAEVAFRLPCLVKHSGQPPRLDVNWLEIQALLPEHAPKPSSKVGEPWRALVDDVLWNYSKFLEGTRA